MGRTYWLPGTWYLGNTGKMYLKKAVRNWRKDPCKYQLRPFPVPFQGSLSSFQVSFPMFLQLLQDSHRLTPSSLRLSSKVLSLYCIKVSGKIITVVFSKLTPRLYFKLSYIIQKKKLSKYFNKLTKIFKMLQIIKNHRKPAQHD